MNLVEPDSTKPTSLMLPMVSRNRLILMSTTNLGRWAESNLVLETVEHVCVIGFLKRAVTYSYLFISSCSNEN